MAGEVGPPDLASFQAAHDLDERCLKGLSELTPSDQLIVIDSVSNTQCKNASAVTWAMVRKMQQHPAAIKLDYLRRRLDARALEALGKLPIQAQESVAAHVDVMKVRNLSAFAWKQIQAVQRSAPALAPMMLPPQLPVRSFVGVQAHLAAASAAAEAARNRSRSPAAVGGGLSMQIAQLRAGLATSSGVGAGRGRGGGGGASDGATSQFLATAGLDPRAAEALMSLDAGSQRMVVGLTQRKPCRNISAVTWSMVKLVRDRPLEAKMEYLRATLDGDALAAFEKLPSNVQDSVLDQVDVTHCRNLSAFVWSKVKGHLAPPGHAGGGESGRPEADPRRGSDARPPQRPVFSASAGEVDGELDPVAVAGVAIDGRCLSKLRELPSEAQLAILQSVPEACRNPSAYVWSKVKGSLPEPEADPRRGSDARPPQQPVFGASAGEVAGELDPVAVAGVAIDGRCLSKLRELPSEAQLAILQSVPEACRNPSAYVWSKVKGSLPKP